jgi:proteic killer suppression protein
VIKSFADADTEALFRGHRPRRLPPSLHRSALKKLLVLQAASALKDLTIPPGNRLEKLRGDRSGQHSIRINDQWRVCFTWRDADAYDVEVADYHS